MQSCNGFGEQIQPLLLCFLLPPVWVLAQSCRKREQQPVILVSRQHTDHISIQSYIYLLCSSLCLVAPFSSLLLSCAPCPPQVLKVCTLCNIYICVVLILQCAQIG